MPQELPVLCAELRSHLNQLQMVLKEGHLRSSLAVTELTVALHYFLDTPKDVLIWDVGHQAYVHKLLTGRREAMGKCRQPGGPSGFTLARESIYDPFGAGHSSTSLSALAGFWKADQIQNRKRKRVAVIGDGALTGGMALEALNYLGEQSAEVWVVLNDNRSSIDANVGALQALDSYATLAKAMGFAFAEVPGDDTDALLKQFGAMAERKGPQFLRVRSHKPSVPQKSSGKLSAPSFQSSFAEAAEAALRDDPQVVIISPAMLSGAHLSGLAQSYPDRVIDVGIAEQHAVTMAAGLAAAGLKPLVHLYSTFAQRAYDQIIHDIALPHLPVVFALDRAGMVGADGPTHHGVFDVDALSCIPGIRFGAPSGGKALREMLHWALSEQAGPVFLRYPKAALEQSTESLWRSYRPHWWHKQNKAQVLISTGALASAAQQVAEEMGLGHLHVPVWRPLPTGDLEEQLAEAQKIWLVEESTGPGGLKADLQNLLGHRSGCELKAKKLPASFAEQGSRSFLLGRYGLDAEGIRGWIQRSRSRS